MRQDRSSSGVSTRRRRGAVGGEAAYRIERVYARLAAQGLRIVKRRCDLTLRQWWIVADMAELKPGTPTELADAADIDKGLLSRNLRALAHLGVVEISRNPQDRREQLIALTDTGWRHYRELLPVMRARNHKLTMGVGAEEFETFLSVLDRIEAATGDDEITDDDIRRAEMPGEAAR